MCIYIFYDVKGEMEVTPACYAHLLSSLMSLASGKVAVVLEVCFINYPCNVFIQLILKTDNRCIRVDRVVIA